MLLVKSFLRSVRHAFAGLGYAFREERNFQIELILGIVVIALSFFFPLSSTEQSLIFLLVGSVLTLELMNTAFERLLDMLKPRIHPYVKVVKDLVAGAVLVGSIAAFLVGIAIFLPYFILMTRSGQ